MTDITIRNEEAGDFREVEHLVREAFWNVNVPGCCEHYLAHVLRSHADFVPELDLVAQTADGTLAASVIFGSFVWIAMSEPPSFAHAAASTSATAALPQTDGVGHRKVQ